MSSVLAAVLVALVVTALVARDDDERVVEIETMSDDSPLASGCEVGDNGIQAPLFDLATAWPGPSAPLMTATTVASDSQVALVDDGAPRLADLADFPVGVAVAAGSEYRSIFDIQAKQETLIRHFDVLTAERTS